ncbi:hypothetical protein ACHAQA_002277 [Verticillium albo-atrum]
MLVESVESEISVASRIDVDLKEVQMNTMLSIYYFHCDEELLAWRLIGTAARAALEMGLHRKQSMIDNFQDMGDRDLAVRVFWCIYALDRRWSFGTSLSFALYDRDIDPDLPEPPRVLHRLRTLLYLRGNHIRTMIHRHYVLTSAAIESDVRAARNVVDIAQDSLQVLVHLNDSSDIYARQQSAFNYFLLSSLAVIILAVCHAPATFAEPCRDSFLAALQLVKGFSLHGSASRRLWKSIRGLVPRVKSLGLQSQADDGRKAAVQERQSETENTRLDTQLDVEATDEQSYGAGGTERQPWNDMWPSMDQDISPGLSSSIPDAFHMSVDLMSLFDSFGMPPDSAIPPGPFEGMLPIEDADEISRRFQGLI